MKKLFGLTLIGLLILALFVGVAGLTVVAIPGTDEWTDFDRYSVAPSSFEGDLDSLKADDADELGINSYAQGYPPFYESSHLWVDETSNGLGSEAMDGEAVLHIIGTIDPGYYDGYDAEIEIYLKPASGGNFVLVSTRELGTDYQFDEALIISENYKKNVDGNLIVYAYIKAKLLEACMNPPELDTYFDQVNIKVALDGWWDDDWSYRQKFNVSISSGSVTNYQVKLRVYQGNGTSSGTTVYCNGHCESDFDDIRFTTDGSLQTALDYWIEYKTSVGSIYADIWVELDSVDSDGEMFYIYYGNPGTTAGSNIDDTFIFADDFDSNPTTSGKWDSVSSYQDSGGSGWATSTIENGGNGKRWRIDAYSTKDAAGYKIKEQFTSTGNFMIEAAGEWQFTDHHRGGGFFLGCMYEEADGALWGYTTYLWGDYYESYRRYIDGSGTTTNTADSTSGTEDFWIGRDENGANDYYYMKIDGTYDATTTGTSSGFATGGYVRLESVTDWWSDPVDLNAWWDWVIVRNYEDPGPTVGVWGTEEESTATDSWWNASWGYRQEFTLTSVETVTNYQVKFTVYKVSSDGSYGTVIDCDNHCESDFDDIRFTTDGASPTTLDYWIESIQTGQGGAVYAYIWVEFDSIDADGERFFVYYGNSDASAVSSIDNTFIFGDDFDSDPTTSGKWDQVTEFDDATSSKTSEIVSGGNGNEWHLFAESDGDAEGYRLFEDITATRFYVQVKGRWANWDMVRGSGETVTCFMNDTQNEYWGTRIRLYGDYKAYRNAWVDSSDSASNVADYSSGTYNGYLYRIENGASDSYGMGMSGTYSYSTSGTHSDFGIGSTSSLWLCAWTDYWTGYTKIDIYYDYVYIRNYIATQPTVSTWGSEETPTYVYELPDSVQNTLGSFKSGTLTNLRYDDNTYYERYFAEGVGEGWSTNVTETSLDGVEPSSDPDSYLLSYDGNVKSYFINDTEKTPYGQGDFWNYICRGLFYYNVYVGTDFTNNYALRAVINVKNVNVTFDGSAQNIQPWIGIYSEDAGGHIGGGTAYNWACEGMSFLSWGESGNGTMIVMEDFADVVDDDGYLKLGIAIYGPVKYDWDPHTLNGTVEIEIANVEVAKAYQSVVEYVIDVGDYQFPYLKIYFDDLAVNFTGAVYYRITCNSQYWGPISMQSSSGSLDWGENSVATSEPWTVRIVLTFLSDEGGINPFFQLDQMYMKIIDLS